MKEFIYNDGYKSTAINFKPITYVVDGECWNCVSHAKNGDGYPKARRIVNGKKAVHYLSRVVYCHHNKCDIPDKLLIRHKCDNPSCINPNHLELGTDQDNTNDRVVRGRQQRGENVGTAILSDDDVRIIKEMLRDGFSNKNIQDMFGIRDSIVSNILAERHWKHIIVDGFNINFKSQKIISEESKDRVDNIIHLLDNTSMNQSEIARSIGVSNSYVTRIKKRHLERE